MEFVEVFVHHQADKKIAARLLLFLRGKIAERLSQHFIGGPIPDLMNEIAFGFGNGPGFADGSAALRNDAGKSHIGAYGYRYSPFAERFTVEINLRGLFGKIAAGKAADDWQRRISLVPAFKPRLAIQPERIGKNQPPVRLSRSNSRLSPPIIGP